MKERRRCHLAKERLDGGSMIELQKMSWLKSGMHIGGDENECTSRIIEEDAKESRVS